MAFHLQSLLIILPLVNLVPKSYIAWKKSNNYLWIMLGVFSLVLLWVCCLSSNGCSEANIYYPSYQYEAKRLFILLWIRYTAFGSWVEVPRNPSPSLGTEAPKTLRYPKALFQSYDPACDEIYPIQWTDTAREEREGGDSQKWHFENPISAMAEWTKLKLWIKY